MLSNIRTQYITDKNQINNSRHSHLSSLHHLGLQHHLDQVVTDCVIGCTRRHHTAWNKQTGPTTRDMDFSRFYRRVWEPEYKIPKTLTIGKQPDGGVDSVINRTLVQVVYKELITSIPTKKI